MSNEDWSETFDCAVEGRNEDEHPIGKLQIRSGLVGESICSYEMLVKWLEDKQ